MRYAIAVAVALLCFLVPMQMLSEGQSNPVDQAYPPPVVPPQHQGTTTQGSTTQGRTVQGSTQPAPGKSAPANGTQGSNTQGNATQGNSTQGNNTPGDNAPGNTPNGQTAQGQSQGAAKAPQSLADLDQLVGRWSGTSKGKPGDGTIERECDRILNGQFIQCRTRATYARETHTDIAIYSYDRNAKKVRMRQFHEEGFVNEYTQTEPGTFVSDSIENLGSGWRAREAYHLMGNGMWHETFSLAGPGKEFETYSQTTLNRAR